MQITDTNLVAEILASPSVQPPPPLTLVKFSQDQILNPLLSDDQLFQENLNEWSDAVNRANADAFRQFGFNLSQWDLVGTPSQRRTGPMPHLPAVPNTSGYITIDSAKVAAYWKTEEAQGDLGQSVITNYSFVVTVMPLPSYPVIAAAPVPPPPDMMTLVGMPMGAGYFAGTPASLLMIPNGQQIQSPLSYTGYLQHMVYLSPFTNGYMDFWIVCLPPAPVVAAPVVSVAAQQAPTPAPTVAATA